MYAYIYTHTIYMNIYIYIYICRTIARMFAFAAVILQRCFQATYPLNLSTRFLKNRKWKKEMNLFFATLLSSHSFSRTGFLKLFFFGRQFFNVGFKTPPQSFDRVCQVCFFKNKKIVGKRKNNFAQLLSSPLGRWTWFSSYVCLGV